MCGDLLYIVPLSPMVNLLNKDFKISCKIAETSIELGLFDPPPCFYFYWKKLQPRIYKFPIDFSIAKERRRGGGTVRKNLILKWLKNFANDCTDLCNTSEVKRHPR